MLVERYDRKRVLVERVMRGKGWGVGEEGNKGGGYWWRGNNGRWGEGVIRGISDYINSWKR